MPSLRRVVLGAIVVSLVVATAAGAGWWFVLREDNQLATSAPAVPGELQGTNTPGGAHTYKIIPEQSEAAYFADEKLASLPLPSTAKGATRAITGEFHLTPDGLGLDPSTPSRFTVDLKTLKSDKDMRDRRVQNQGLESAKYPTATFTATRVTGYDPSLDAGAEQALQLTGTMDLHGVQKELTWEVKARRQGNVMTALATVKFKFADFNIPVLHIAGFVSVQDSVTLQVQIVAQS